MSLTKETVLQAFVDDPKLAKMLSIEQKELFARLAAEGSNLDFRMALRVLVNGYIDNCGLSAGVRTIYYDAGQYIFQKFLKTDDPLAERLRKEEIDCFCDCMDQFNELYTKEEYGEYDITLLSMEDYPDMCMEECSYNIPEKQKAALCYGIYLVLTDDFLD